MLAAGFKKAATWGTAAVLGALNGVNCKSIGGFNRSQDMLIANEIDTPVAFSGALDSIKPPEPTITTDFLYDPGALGTAIALLWSTAGAPVQQGATTAYLHTFQWANMNWNKFGTFAVEMPGVIWEAASAKPIEWSLKVQGGGFVQSELKLRCNTIINNSGVNGATQMDALTYKDRDNRAIYKHLTVKMNDQSGADVSGTSALVGIAGVEVSYKRGGYDAVVPCGSYAIDEPAEGGYSEVTVKLSWHHADVTNLGYFTTALAETTQKALIEFTSAALAGVAYPYKMALFFPRLRMKFPEASYDEIVKNGLELYAEEASAAPTGMAYARHYMTLTNKTTTDYLA